jgi:hypothetical protein
MEQAADRLAVVGVRAAPEAVLVHQGKDIQLALVVANQVAAAPVAQELMERLRGRPLVHRALAAPELTLISLLRRFLPN